jgi:hypothetical protein
VNQPANCLFKIIGGYRAFLKRTHHAVTQFRFVKRLAAIVCLYQSWHDEFGRFERGESLVAVQALPATTNLSTIACKARIDHFGFFVTAERTMHFEGLRLFSVSFRIALNQPRAEKA